MSKYLLLWGCSENVIKLELNFRFKLVINGVKQYLSGKPEIIITGENGKMQLEIYSHLSPILNAEKKHLNRIDLWRS